MTGRTHLISSMGYKRLAIEVSDILMFKSDKKYTDAYMSSGVVHMLHDDTSKSGTINHLEKEFSDEFILVKRGCLVRRAEIVSIARDLATGRRNLQLTNGVCLPVSRREAPAVREMLQQRENEKLMAQYKEIEASHAQD